MEVSSHALDQRRVDSVHFRGRIFTNLTPEHLDYHGTMENYAKVKSGFFEHSEFGAAEYAVVNVDDELGQEILSAAEFPALSYGFGEAASLTARVTGRDLNGIECELFFRDGNDAGWPDAVTEFKTTIRSPLMGRYNVLNILAAAGAALMENVGAAEVAAGLEGVRAIPGRLERVENPRGLHVFVDYAHTPDALSNVLQTVREVAAGARIICVFGCGGDRDREKRPLMGQTVSAMTDYIIVTNDNPRSESPRQIIDEILAGIPDEARTRCTVEPDRRRAIETALSTGKAGDIVLIAGKGHEDYQIFADRTEHFSDAEVAREFLN
jgi:UDP-N-acetylmuramyl-tripeptide synthetase